MFSVCVSVDVCENVSVCVSSHKRVGKCIGILWRSECLMTGSVASGTPYLHCLSRLCTVAIPSGASTRVYVNAILGMGRAERRAHTLLLVQFLNTTDKPRVEYRTNIYLSN